MKADQKNQSANEDQISGMRRKFHANWKKVIPFLRPTMPDKFPFFARFKDAYDAGEREQAQRYQLNHLAIVALLVLLPSLAFAQAVRFDFPVYTTSGTAPRGSSVPVLAVPNATVAVCQDSVCASRATTYTSASAGTPCGTQAQLTPAAGGTCTAVSDSQGNAGFWILPGSYYYQVTFPGVGGATYGPLPITLGAQTGCPSGVTCDANYSSLAAAVTAAGSGTLYISRSWNATTSQTVNNLNFLSTGKIVMASGQALTVSGTIAAPPAQQIFDVSASGSSVVITQSVYATWFGNTAAAFNLALSSGSLDVSIPSGTYTLSASLTPVNGQHIRCAGTGYQGTSPALLKFSNAGDGFVLGDTNNVEIDDCMIQTTNASAGKGVNATTGSGAGHKLNRLSFFNSGSGAWAYGIYLNGAIAVSITQPYCYSIAKCVSANNGSNGTDIYSPLIGGSGTTAIEAAGSSPVNVWGGVDEGAYSDLWTVDGASTFNMTGTYLESSGGQTNIATSSGVTTLRNIHLGGNAVTGDGIWFSGTSPAVVDGVTGGTTVGAGKCLIRYDGNNANTSHIFDLQGLTASTTGTGSHALCIGTASTGVWGANITGNYLASDGTAVVVSSTGGGSINISGNTLSSGSAYGIDITGLGGVLFAHDNDFASVSSGACTGCTFTHTAPEQYNLLNTTQTFLLTGVQHVAALPTCNQYTEGEIRPVDDATSTTFHASVAGSGTNHVNAYCAGAALGWVIGG